MSIDRWIVIGAGGHARVVMDALLREPLKTKSFVFADDDVTLHGHSMLGISVLGSANEIVQSGEHFHVAVGSNCTRELLYSRMMNVGGLPFSVIHPSACISAFASVGVASFIAARAVIAPATKIGVGVIINHSAVVDHDCTVGDFCHIAPGATLAGGVTLGFGVLVGVGARVLPGITIGDNALIGAGAVVTTDVAANAKMIGVPARII